MIQKFTYRGLAALVVCFSTLGNAEARTYTSPERLTAKAIKEDYKRVNKDFLLFSPENLFFSYDLWKAAVENPGGIESKKLKAKANFLNLHGDYARSKLEGKELDDYNHFWKHFHLDVKQIPIQKDDLEEAELIIGIAVPLFVEMQTEIDKLYGIRPDYSHNNKHLSPGEKIIIYRHYQHFQRHCIEKANQK